MGGTKQIPVSVRVLAATNIDLREAVAAGRFRRDLYERLKPLHIQLPALRERREDIPALAKHFLTKETNLSNQEDGNKAKTAEVLGISRVTLNAKLRTYSGEA